MTDKQEYNTGVIAAVGGTGAAIGASAATVVDTDPKIGLILAFGAGMVISGGLVLVYSQLS